MAVSAQDMPLQVSRCRGSSSAQGRSVLAQSLTCAGNQNYADCFNAQKPVGDAETMAKWADLKMLRVVNKPDLVPTVSHFTYLGLLHHCIADIIKTYQPRASFQCL